MKSEAEPTELTNAPRFAQALMRVALPEIERVVSAAGSAVSGDVDRHEAARWLIGHLTTADPGLTSIIRAWLDERKIVDRTFFNTLWWADKSFAIWCQHSRLDEFIKRAFSRRRFVFAGILLEYMEFVFEDDHALARLIDLIERVFQGWVDDGQVPPPFIHTPLKRFGEFLDDPRCLEADFREQVLADIEATWSRESRRREKLEQRLLESELGLDEAWVSQNRALQTVNEALQKPLPQTLTEFLTGPWLDSIRLIYLDHGYQSKKARIVHALTQNLAWLCRERPSKDRQRQLSLGARILDDLEPYFMSLDHEPELKMAWMEQLQGVLLKVLKGEHLDRQMPRALPMEALPDCLEDAGEKLSPWIGRWFAQGAVRKKLLTFLPGRQQVLWCDINGRKLGYEPVPAVLEALESGRLQPLDDQGSLRLALRKVAEKLIVLDVQQSKQRIAQQDKREALIRLARQKAAAEAERLRTIRQQLASPSDEAQHTNQTAQVITQAQGVDAPGTGQAPDTSTARDSAGAQAHDSDDRGAQRMYSRILNTLKADSWIRIDDGDRARKYRIAARLQSTGKFILANELGTRARDLSWQEALELLSAGKLTILGEGEDMNARMTRTFGRITRRRK